MRISTFFPSAVTTNNEQNDVSIKTLLTNKGEPKLSLSLSARPKPVSWQHLFTVLPMVVVMGRSMAVGAISYRAGLLNFSTAKDAKDTKKSPTD